MKSGNSCQVSITWAVWKDNREVPIIRDRSLNIIEAFLDYALATAKDKMDAHASESAFRSALEYVAYALLALARYLATRPGITWSQLDDSTLVEFRDWVQSETRKHPRSVNDESSWRTANARLRVIYDFLAWAQEDALLVTNLIGNTSQFPVRSSIPLLKKTGNSSLGHDKQKYPKVMTGVGAKSRKSDRQYWATEDDLEELRQYFWMNSGLEVATRNDLMMRLFDARGWRRASLNSLTVDQFSKERLLAAEAAGDTHLSVMPPEQKRGYKRSFLVPLVLAWSVHRYIDKERKALLKDKKAESIDIHKNRIFISTTTCEPLTHQTVSKIFGQAFRAIGAPRGAAPHSFRRKFTKERYAQEIEFRQREGLSLAHEDVAMALADDLGQASISSQDAYFRAIDDIRNQSVEEELRAKVAALDDKLARSYAELTRLRNSIPQEATPLTQSTKSAALTPRRAKTKRAVSSSA